MKKKSRNKAPDESASSRAATLLGVREDEILSSVTFNLKSDGSHADGICAVTKDRTYKIEDGKTVLTIENRDIKQFEFDDGFGCSMLTLVKTNGEGFNLCRADMKFRDMYVQSAAEMTEKATGHAPEYGSSRKVFTSKGGSFGGGFRRADVPPPGGGKPHPGQSGKIKNGVPTGSACPKCGRPYRPGTSRCDRCDRGRDYFKWMWSIVSPFKMRVFAAIVLFFSVTGINLIIPQLNRVMVDDYIKSKDPGVSIVGFILVLMGILGIRVLVIAIGAVRSLVMNRVGEGVTVRLRETVFGKIQKMSVSGINRMTTGELMQRVTHDTMMIKGFITDEFAQMIENILTFIGVVIMLFIFDWKLAIMILAPAPFAMVFWRLFSNKVHKIYHRQWQMNTKSRSILQDIFSGIRVVKSYGSEESEIEKYDRAIDDEKKIQIRNEVFFGKVSPTLNFLMGFGEFFLLFYGGNLVFNGSMTLGQMMQFSSYASMIYGPLRWMTNLPRTLIRISTSLSKIYDVMEDDDMLEKRKELDMPINGEIVFDHVGFGYEKGSVVLEDICTTIKPGEMVGIVGKSGIGKSTMTNLVMRMYDVDKGRILIDGTDIRDISESSLRSQIGAVLQETFLFSGTVYANISYARPDASRDEVIAAAKAAGAHKFIIKMQDGYNTYIGEHGYTLSGGERQRIAIARAILRDPRILILDEATSALDTETEKEIQDALQVLAKGRTVIAIAHRLSTLRNCDRILVISDGKVAEEGPHDELMRLGGIYASLVLAQRQMFRIKKEEKAE